MKETSISIIIPVFNIKKYIEKCIFSILEQDYQNYEILVINDGSTDNSEEVIRKIRSNKIKIINKENGGLSSARNEGVKHAKGEYIWFIDGDDYIERDSLKTINELVNNKKYDIISFGFYKETYNKKELQRDDIDILDKKQYILVNTSACTKVFNRTFYIENRFHFSEGKIYEDLSLIPFIMSKTQNIKFIEKPLYNYVYRENSIMNNNIKFNKNRDDKFFALDRLTKLFKKNDTFLKYYSEIEYLVIKHLLIVYSTEILKFNKKIYKDRCKHVLEYLNTNYKEWEKNKYLMKTPILTKIYIYMFKRKLFMLCKIALLFKKR